MGTSFNMRSKGAVNGTILDLLHDAVSILSGVNFND
jgi:hypothetical protein